LLQKKNLKKKNTKKKKKKKENPNGPYSNSLSTLVPFCPINIDGIVTWEKRALKEEFQSQNRIGIGVTEEAQQIFEILVKQWYVHGIINLLLLWMK